MGDPPGHRSAYLAYRGGAVAARVVPVALGDPLARGLGRVSGLFMADRRRMVARHQARVAPVGSRRELRRRVQAAFASYGRYWLELFRLPAETPEAIDAGFTIDGYERIEAPLAAGRGVVVALPHLGGWEHAGAWLARRGHPPLAVVEPVEPPELLEWFAAARRAMGIDVVPVGDGVTGVLLRALRAGRVVTLVSDRDLTGDGVEVEFFGERTTLPGGPATLALRTGATLLPAAVYFQPHRGHHAVVRPAVSVEREGRLRDDVARITQDLAREFEALVRAAPEQWHLMQPNWPSDRGAVVTKEPAHR